MVPRLAFLFPRVAACLNSFVVRLVVALFCLGVHASADAPLAFFASNEAFVLLNYSNNMDVTQFMKEKSHLNVVFLICIY